MPSGFPISQTPDRADIHKWRAYYIGSPEYGRMGNGGQPGKRMVHHLQYSDRHADLHLPANHVLEQVRREVCVFQSHKPSVVLQEIFALQAKGLMMPQRPVCRRGSARSHAVGVMAAPARIAEIRAARRKIEDLRFLSASFDVCRTRTMARLAAAAFVRAILRQHFLPMRGGSKSGCIFPRGRPCTNPNQHSWRSGQKLSRCTAGEACSCCARAPPPASLAYDVGRQHHSHQTPCCISSLRHPSFLDDSSSIVSRSTWHH